MLDTYYFHSFFLLQHKHKNVYENQIDGFLNEEKKIQTIERVSIYICSDKNEKIKKSTKNR